MDFFTFIIAIVAIGAGSSIISSIASAIKPKVRKKDIEAIKAELRSELGSDEIVRALPNVDRANRRIEELEAQVEHLSEETDFLKRLIDKD